MLDDTLSQSKAEGGILKDKSRRLSNTRGRTRGETRKANSNLSCRQISFVLATLPNVAQSGSPATKTQRPSLKSLGAKRWKEEKKRRREGVTWRSRRKKKKRNITHNAVSGKDFVWIKWWQKETHVTSKGMNTVFLLCSGIVRGRVWSQMVQYYTWIWSKTGLIQDYIVHLNRKRGVFSYTFLEIGIGKA